MEVRPHLAAGPFRRVVGVDQVGEEEHDRPRVGVPGGPFLRPGVEVEPRLPGDRHAVRDSPRPQLELAVPLAANGHVVGDRWRERPHALSVRCHGQLGDRRLLLRHEEGDSEPVAGARGGTEIKEDVRGRHERIELASGEQVF